MNWMKWDYVCPQCDANIEMTLKSDGQDGHISLCPKCRGHMTLMSVVDATILPIPTKKEEEMTDVIPTQTITLTWIENDVPTSKTYTENDIRSMVWVNKNLTNKQNEWYRKESQLRTLLHEVYDDSEDQDTLTQIAGIFDVPLTKEIEVTAYVRVDMTVEVDMREGDYDLEDLVHNQISVEAYGSEVSVNDFEVERVEERGY